MKRSPSIVLTIWQFLAENLSTLITIVAAVVALVLSQLNLIPGSVLPGIIIALLALLATTQLIDNRRTHVTLSMCLQLIEQQIQSQRSGAEVRKFTSAETAIDYMVQRTKAARFSVDQASIDKQRARKTEARLRYEKAREELILSDRIRYRYIGIVDDQRRFRAVMSLMEKGPLHSFYAAFGSKPSEGLPLLNFVIFDREEVVTRAPYDLGQEPIYVSIRSPEVAQLFQGYFEKLWDQCKTVEKVEDIREMLGK